jgi:hypothetical protein
MKHASDGTTSLAMIPSAPSAMQGVTKSLRAITLLGACAASVVLFVWEITDERGVEFLQKNELRMVARQALLGQMLVATVAATCLSFGYLALGAGGRQVVMRTARVAAPLALLGFLPALCIRGTWDPLSTAIAVGAMTIGVEQLLRLSLGEIAVAFENADRPIAAAATRPRLRTAAGIAAACCAVAAAYLAISAIFNYRQFGPHALQLAQYDNVLYSTLHGHPFQSGPAELRDWQYLGKNMEYSVLFLLPVYALRPGAEMLLVVRALLLALGSIPVFRFASRRMPPLWAAALSACYLLYPPLHALNFQAFTLVPLAIASVLFAIDFVDAKRPVLAALACVVAVGCGVSISIDLALLGLFLLLSGYRPRTGAVLSVAALSYFVVARSLLIPHLRAGWSHDAFTSFVSRADDLEGISEFVGTLVGNPVQGLRKLATPEKLGELLQILAPVAFLPLRRGHLALALAPLVLFTVPALANESTRSTVESCEHFVPYIFMATAAALGSYGSGRTARVTLPAAFAALVTGTLLTTIHWGAFPPRPASDAFAKFHWAWPTALEARRESDLAELLAMVPEGATCAVSDPEIAHASHRLGARAIRSGAETDYILWAQGSSGAELASNALGRGEYIEVARRPGLTLIRRKPGAR